MVIVAPGYYGVNSMMTLLTTAPIAGIVCGVHCALTQPSRTTGKKALVGILWAIGSAIAAFGLGGGGCLLMIGLQIESP